MCQDDGVEEAGLDRDSVLQWWSQVPLQCPLWCGQDCVWQDDSWLWSRDEEFQCCHDLTVARTSQDWVPHQETGRGGQQQGHSIQKTLWQLVKYIQLQRQLQRPIPIPFWSIVIDFRLMVRMWTRDWRMSPRLGRVLSSLERLLFSWLQSLTSWLELARSSTLLMLLESMVSRILMELFPLTWGDNLNFLWYNHPPCSCRQLNAVLTYEGYSGLAAWIPDCVRIPHWIMHFLSYKFWSLLLTEMRKVTKKCH